MQIHEGKFDDEIRGGDSGADIYVEDGVKGDNAV